MKLTLLLESLWMGSLEQEVYLCVAKYNKITASNVAQQLGRERTSTYKRMKQMVWLWWLIQTHERGTSFFLPVDLSLLKERFLKQLDMLRSLDTHRHDVEQEYTALQSAHQFDTSIKLLSWTESIRYAYQKMQQLLRDEQYIIITCLSTHTLEALSWWQDSELTDLYNTFYNYLRQHHIKVSSHLCEWLSLMESITHSTSLSHIASMPVANNATTIWIIGDDIFLLFFTQEPQTIHFHSSHAAWLLRFIVEQLEQ